MLNNRNAQSGFTIVEMVVVVGVISVLAIGFASYLYQQTKSMNAGQNRENFNQLQINILSSSGKSDVLLQSESMQIKDYGKIVISCGEPCLVQPGDDGKDGCYYKVQQHADGDYPVCVSIPTGCKFLGVGCN